MNPSANTMMNIRIAALIVWSFTHYGLIAHGKDTASVERIGDDIRYLASDELEGRGPQTKGLELAAQRIEKSTPMPNS